MKILVTAGHTREMIDRVRSLENIFSGKTGTAIAEAFARAGHEVVLFTSSPELVDRTIGIDVSRFKSFDELETLMRQEIAQGGYDVIVHSAAVGDYKPTGRQFTIVDPDAAIPIFTELPPRGKIPSGHTRLLIELEPTIKLIDLIRGPLGFQGFLVKFKLQVDNDAGEPMSDEELIAIASRSREHSDADLIVANCLAWARDRAIIIGRDNVPEHVSREEIAHAIMRRIV